jgi:hypothetical protein
MMRVFAYCCAEFAGVTRRAAGVSPFLSPPVTANSFGPAILNGFDFYYFDLHGDLGGDFWYTVVAGTRVPSLTADQVRGANMQGAIVFAAGCYLGDENSPMLDALLAAGARYVIGGAGRNYGPQAGWLYGAPLLGLWVRRLVGLGIDPLWALRMAKRAVATKRVAAADTLAFRAFYRKG